MFLNLSTVLTEDSTQDVDELMMRRMNDGRDVFKSIALAPVIPTQDKEDHADSKTPVSSESADEEEGGESEEIKNLLEEKYRFVNDEMSTRYKITNEDREYPGKRGRVSYNISSKLFLPYIY